MNVKWTVLIAGAAMVITIGAAQAAGNPAAGQAKAGMCAACHGPTGKGVAPNPPLAGKSEAQLAQALHQYKSGQRPNPVMKGIAASLSDQDIDNLATYFASLR